MSRITHIKCKQYYDAFTGDYECGYKTSIPCEDCKYGTGNEDPENVVKFECDECGTKSDVYYKEEIEDDALDTLESMGWNYSEGVLFCKDCSDSCRR